METTRSERFLKGAIITGIVIVLNMFFNYALSLLYKEPLFDSYMQRPQIVSDVYTQERCLTVGGQWTAIAKTEGATDPQTKLGGYCDPDYSNRLRYDADKKDYNRTVFIILTALGAFVLGLGTVLKARYSVVALALSWGGVLSFVIASLRYWADANTLFKVLILGVVLVVLIVLAARRFSKQS